MKDLPDKVKGFIVLRSHVPGIRLLSRGQKGDLLDALVADMMGEAQPVLDPVTNVVFSMMLPAIHDAQEEYKRKAQISRENGKNGGRPKKQQDEEKPNGLNGEEEKPVGFEKTSRLSENQNRIDKNKEDEKKIEPKESTPLPPAGGQRAPVKEKKTPYGQFGNVLLTEKEYQSLQDEFGITGTQERIDNLDEYIASKGTRYKSHYATILSWNRRDSQKPQPVMRQARLSEAEERQRHNDEVCRQVSAELEAINSPF